MMCLFGPRAKASGRAGDSAVPWSARAARTPIARFFSGVSARTFCQRQVWCLLQPGFPVTELYALETVRSTWFATQSRSSLGHELQDLLCEAK